jgi:hypothetical protein
MVPKRRQGIATIRYVRSHKSTDTIKTVVNTRVKVVAPVHNCARHQGWTSSAQRRSTYFVRWDSLEGRTWVYTTHRKVSLLCAVLTVMSIVCNIFCASKVAMLCSVNILYYLMLHIFRTTTLHMYNNYIDSKLQ